MAGLLNAIGASLQSLQALRLTAASDGGKTQNPAALRVLSLDVPLFIDQVLSSAVGILLLGTSQTETNNKLLC